MKERENNEFQLERKNISPKDFLKSIEFEYNLERQRRKKYKALKIKKQGTKDFSSKTFYFFFKKKNFKKIKIFTSCEKNNITLGQNHLQI